MDQDKVTVAFKVIIEDIRATIARLNDEGAEAFRQSKYEQIDRLRAMAEELAAFGKSVEYLQSTWVGTFVASYGGDNGRTPVQESPSMNVPMQESPTMTVPVPEPPPPAATENAAAGDGTGLLGRLGQLQ